MSVSAGHRGVDAVKNRDWAAALPLLNQALADSESPAWLLARAHALQQLGRLDPALRDAELAYHVARARGSRQLMAEAQYRRACVLFRMDRHADSDFCAKWSMLLCEGELEAACKDWAASHVDDKGCSMITSQDAAMDKENQPRDTGGEALAASLGGPAPPDSGKKKADPWAAPSWNRAYVWRSQVVAAMERLPIDDLRRKVTVTLIPAKPTKNSADGTQPGAKPEAAKLETAKATSGEAEPPAKEAEAVSDDKLKLRADFYQTNRTVTVTVFAKGMQLDPSRVAILDHAVSLGPVPRAAIPSLSLDDRRAYSTLLLAGKIDPAASRWTSNAHKAEFVLQKAEPGVKWATWGREEIGEIANTNQDSAAPALASTAEPVAEAQPAPTSEAATATTAPPPPEGPSELTPTYPTSSKTGPKNWDKLVQDGTDEADEADQDVNFFFKKLYAGATEEQRRAMMKSFIESNGTSLSTDWNDVKDRTVEMLPPEGVEAKKWDA